ncbi:MAG TPA: DUF6644 family protein [Bryobacteraceae bacterium]|jgi:hypothetical protein|nr:DUF6644 family protein [Bryobacteraceae bacterium]
MASLQASPLGHAMRESGVWTYGVVNLVHILGVATLFGSVLVLDLRLLGVWRSVALAAISRPTVPAAATGFVIAALSGVCLLATKATEYVGNPFLYIKFPAIGLGILNVVALSRLSAWKQHRSRDLSSREQTTLAVFGGISLFCWLTAISAGRMIGYW